MKTSIFLQAGAISGFLAVALGAFGAHGLKSKLSADMMAVYQTAVQYHFTHTLALLAVGILILQMGRSTALQVSGFAFLFGLIVFSGSLYTLAITEIRWLGAITPIGGLAFLIGWASLFWACLKAA